jgi:hypothetical protein
MTHNLTLADYFTNNVSKNTDVKADLPIPFMYLPYLNNRYIMIHRDNKYYKYLIDSENHYHMDEIILKNRESWIECQQDDKDCSLGCFEF